MGKDKGGKGGTVINLASILGLQGLEGCPIYVGTKHFVIGFTRSIGTPFYFEKHGVNVMALCPGVTDTELITEANEFGLPGSGEKLVQQLGELPAQP